MQFCSAKLFLQLGTQILSALSYLEELNIVHGHFSPRSCLLMSPPKGNNNLPNVCVASPRGINLHAQLRFSAPEAIILVSFFMYCYF